MHRNLPVCIPNKQSIAPLCCEVSRSWVHSDRCFSSELEPVDGVYSCSDSAIAKDSSKNTPARPNNRVSDSPDVVGTALVPSLTRDASGFSSPIASSRDDTLSSIQSTSDTSIVENSSSSRISAVGSRLQATGLSPEVWKILLAWWRTSTQTRYEGPWQLWASWSLKRNKCPFSAPVSDVLAFLTEQFNSPNLAYRTFWVYKACSSQLHDPVVERQLGNLLVVSRFMKESFN